MNGSNSSSSEELAPKQKAEREIDIDIRIRILDRIYTQTRQRIREKGGMIRHEDAMRMVLKEDEQKILDDLKNEAIEELDNPTVSRFSSKQR
jgi:hypothetical protein